MEDASPDSNESDTWTDRAVQYAEDYGWQIVPLQANSKSSPQYSDDPVERQLNSFIPIDYEADATADPDAIEHLGIQFPVALIGARTGTDSDLLAVEILHRDIQPGLRDQIDRLASEAPRVLGTNREYVLFTYPEIEETLPALTSVDGAVLHGEGSVIQLPWRYYRWSLHPRELAPPSNELISLFREAEDDVPAGPQDSIGSPDAPEDEEPLDVDEDLAVESPNERELSAPEPEEGGEDSLFRTGAALRAGTQGQQSTFASRWTVPAGLTVVAGRPKSSGKSTWVLHLAAHRAAGESFLDAEAEPTDVVLLTDGPPTTVQGALRRLDFATDTVLSRLHVVHPGDVVELDWEETLERAYRRAQAVAAGLVVVDSLDVYVRLKNGGDPTTNEAVVRALTTEAPSDCSIVAVQSVSVRFDEPMSDTVEGLGLLGVAADRIVRLDNVSSDADPTLRRIQCIGRAPQAPATMYVARQDDRYERVPAEDVASAQ